MSSKQMAPKSDTEQRISMVKTLVTPSILEEVAVRSLNRPCRVTGVEFRAAADHVTGFLGDHFRVSLSVIPEDCSEETLHLFVKTSSLLNKDKAAFIETGNFFRRERLVFSLFDELGGGDADGHAAWHVEGLYHSESVLIMRDMAALGYSTRHVHQPFDLPYLLLGVSAIARFHASYANFASARAVDGQEYDLMQEYGSILQESNWVDCKWLRTAAKLDADMVRELSDKYNSLPNLQEDLTRLYIAACDTAKTYEDTLNVLIHKDAWANNILFRHDKGQPTHAILIDYQCIRYVPPAFDIMSFIYLNTTKHTREQYEEHIINHYYQVFQQHLKDTTKHWLKTLNYDSKCVRKWCEKARMFGTVLALGIFPYILMDGETARMFDDPKTFVELCDVDRSAPVLDYARKHTEYRDRQMEVMHEFIQRYLEV